MCVTVEDVINFENKKIPKRYVTEGYVRIYLPLHPASNKRGWIREHRWVMEKHLGRFLIEDEVVHHINDNPIDNRIENLQLMRLPEHISYHRLKDKEQRDNRLCYNDSTHKTTWNNSVQCWNWYFLDGDKNKPICQYCKNRDYKKKNREAHLERKRRYYQRNRERILKQDIEKRKKKKEGLLTVNNAR